MKSYFSYHSAATKFAKSILRSGLWPVTHVGAWRCVVQHQRAAGSLAAPLAVQHCVTCSPALCNMQFPLLPPALPCKCRTERGGIKSSLLKTFWLRIEWERGGRKKNQGMSRCLISMNISCWRIFLTQIIPCSPVAIHVL